MNRTGILLTVFGLFFLTAAAPAQSVRDRIRQADALHANYDFDGAIKIYEQVLSQSQDDGIKASLSEKIIQSGNGKSMLQYATRPELVTSRTVSRTDFFLYYSHFADGSWVKTPNAFVSDNGHQYGKAMLFDSSKGSVVFAAPDGDGLMTLFSSTRGGNGLWSVPEAISSCRSAGDEVLPLVSASGKELYFSSDALAGMGGYDLFVSRWNERRKCWGEPENLGFPYSSTSDDFLFSNTPDGEYTVFASNRNCAADSMTIYVLRFVNSPIKSAVTSPAEAAEIASFARKALKSGKTGTASADGTAKAQTSIEKAYYDCYAKLQDTKARIRELMPDKQGLLDLQMQAGQLSEELCQLELKLLAAGGRIDHSKKKAAVEAPAAGEYSFAKRSLGKLSGVELDVPVEEDVPTGLTKAKESAIFSEIPDGLVYMIQVAVVSRKISSKELKNFSPAFYVKQPSGKYLYAVGRFKSYKEASAALGKVKAEGFKDACVIAWKNGKSIAVSKAKTEEDGYNCFGIIAGKNCTTDGTVLIGHNEDDPGEQLLNIYATDKYLWVEFPKLFAADAFLTRTGVAVVSDNCRSREDKPMLSDGGIYYRLRVEVAKRAQSARDGMHIIGELIEKYGYGDSGRSYLLADAEEGWVVSVVNGKHWVAQRVPDDQVMVIPNYYVIDKVDLDDTVNFAGSKDIVSYAIQRGWYDPSKDGEFSFRKAYSSDRMLKSKSNIYRHKAALDYFRGGYADPEAQHPFSFKPAKKVSVQEMINALSLHNADGVGTGSICGKSTVVSTIFQLRDNMPKELGCVMWTAMGHPCIEAYIPWYLGLKKAPEGWNRFESWETAEERHFEDSVELHKNFPDCHYWRYADRWAQSKDDILLVEKQRKVTLKPFQKLMFKEARIFEKKMMNKYGSRQIVDADGLSSDIETFLNGCYRQYDLL